MPSHDSYPPQAASWELVVHEKHLNQGVHEYMVWYTATCVATSDAGTVRIVVDCALPAYCFEPHPNSEGASLVECALEHIRRGATAAIERASFGLELLITELRIHPVDFQPKRFDEHTRNALTRQLAQRAEPSRGTESG